MALTNNNQSMDLTDHQEGFRALSYDLKELQDEKFSLNQGSAIAKDPRPWNGIDRRKQTKNKDEISKLTYVDLRVNKGDLSSGRMGLELSSEIRQFDVDGSLMKWWIEIFTAHPFCLYYFGAFSTFQEARILKQGFKQDLLDEGASILCLEVKYCSPTQLTIPSSELTAQEFERLQFSIS